MGAIEKRISKTQKKGLISKLCRLLGYTRDAYYKSKKRDIKSEIEDRQVLDLVKKERRILQEQGGKKCYYQLKGSIAKKGIKMGRDAFLNLLRVNGLLIRRKKYKMPVTDSKHPFRKYKNLLKAMEVESQDEVWVSDITYIRVGEKWHYLTLITDLYSRKIMGYSFSIGMRVKETTGEAMKMALRNKKSGGPTVLHSDRGFQYCNPNFIESNKKRGIVPSMTENGDPYENAVAERLNGILKYEFGLRWGFKAYEQADQEVKRAIRLYNSYRPHWSLNLQTPNDVYTNGLRMKEE